MPSAYDWQLHHRIREMQQRDGTIHKFYCWKAWVRLRAKVLAEGHYECVDCLAESPAKYTRAECVHHVHEVEREPGWALTQWVGPQNSGEPNLVPLCHRHHDLRHGRFCHAPRSHGSTGGTGGVPLTIERW